MNKIEALKATLVKLNDKNTFYDWTETDSCNCGILAQCMMSKSSIEDADFALWGCGATRADKNRCSVTGAPLDDIFRILFDCGFTSSDIVGLEQLNDVDVCNKLGWTRYSNGEIKEDLSDRMAERKNVIAYITAWIEILEEENPAVNKSLTTEKVYVTVQVDSVVKELVSKESLHTESIMN